MLVARLASVETECTALLRHLTTSKGSTGFMCFLLSAVLHEVVIAFPLRSFYMPLAFFGMIAQVPLVPLSAWLLKKTKGTVFDQLGNYLFWATFLPYRRARASLGGALHATLATYLWINVVWNYAMCAAVVAGERVRAARRSSMLAYTIECRSISSAVRRTRRAEAPA